MNGKSSNFWGLLSLALALVLFGLVVGHALRNIRGAADAITVTGSAKRAIRSDYVVWRGAVSSQHASLQEAYQEISRNADHFRAFLRENQIPDSAVAIRHLETNPIQEVIEGRGSTGRILAYSLRQPFEIRSGQVEAITALANRASQLITSGIVLESYGLEYLITSLSELRGNMLAEAATDAKARAESIAHSVGSKIGPVRSARMGVFQITARNSTQVSDYGIYDTSSLEKDITAVVSITFAVK
jgi:uncharacterized protein